MILSNKFRLFLLFLLLSYTVGYAQQNSRDTIFVQTDTAFNVLGIPNYYYTRIFEYDSEKPAEILITFVFTTQKNQAITYRQETLNGRLEWLEKEGVYKKEGIVEAVTTYLPAHNTVTWKYRYIVNTKPADEIITFDKSALLMMDDNLKVEKIVWGQRKLLLKKNLF